jgi:peptidoglycan-associated lipoprotein
MASTGCKHKKGNLTPPAATTNTQAGAGDTAGNTALPPVDVTQLEWIDLPGASPIHFDYDSSALRDDARTTLKTNADAINGLPAEKKAMVEGHCDERGTQEYNLALGERRAQAARDYLIQLGVPADRLLTVSYGEEQPANPGHDEAAWAQNRRDEFKQSR